MTNTVDNKVILSDGRFYVHRYLILSDGSTALSDLVVIDKSALTHAETNAEPSALDLIEMEATAGGTINSLALEWDHTTDDEILAFGPGANGVWRRDWGPLKDPRSAGDTGDVVITSNGLSTGAWLQIYAVWQLRK